MKQSHGQTDLAGQANVASNNNSAYIHGQQIKKSNSSTLGQAEGIGPGSRTSELSNIDVIAQLKY